MLTIIAQKIDEDLESSPSVDMLMTCRGKLVFAWDSADQVIHIFDCESRRQHPRVVHEMEFWTQDVLETFADLYVERHLGEGEVR